MQSQIKLSFDDAVAIFASDPSVRTLNATYKKGSNTLDGVVILDDSRSGLIFDSDDNRLKNRLNFVIREEWIDKYVSIYAPVQEPPDIVFEKPPAIVLKPETKVLVDGNNDSSKVSVKSIDDNPTEAKPTIDSKSVSSQNLSYTDMVNANTPGGPKSNTSTSEMSFLDLVKQKTPANSVSKGRRKVSKDRREKRSKKSVTFSTPPPQLINTCGAKILPDGYISVECGKVNNDCFYNSVMYCLTGDIASGFLLKRLLERFVVYNDKLQTNNDPEARLGDKLRDFVSTNRTFFDKTYNIEESFERMKEYNPNFAHEQDIMLTIQAIRLGLLGSRCENISFVIWDEGSGKPILRDEKSIEVVFINKQPGHFQALVPERGFEPIYPELCNNIKFRRSELDQKINSRKLSGKSSPCDEGQFSLVRWTDQSSGAQNWSNAWVSQIRSDRTFDVHWCCDGTVDTYTFTKGKDPVLKPPEGNPIRHPEWKPTKSYLNYRNPIRHPECKPTKSYLNYHGPKERIGDVLNTGASVFPSSSASHLPCQNATDVYSWLAQGGSGAYAKHLP